MDGVLNLSAFGDIIDNPKKKLDQKMEMPVFGSDYRNSHHTDKTKAPSDDFTFGGFNKVMDQPKDSDNKQNNLTHRILADSAQIKLFHWQTCSYAEHKTMDKLLDSFSVLSDNLLESVMGKYGRPSLSSEHAMMKLKNYSEENLCHFIDEMYKCYSNELKCLFDMQTDSEIINILDEILALTTKTKYLLTLK